MKYRISFPILVLTLSTFVTWQTAACQNVVQNPTATQTITQPSGTQFNVNGVQTLLWPSVFRIANETGNTMVFRDMTQTDAWFFATVGGSSSAGTIEFFGNYSSGGSLIPNAPSKGAVGTFNNPWLSVVADGGSFGSLAKGVGSFKIDHPLDPMNKYLQHSFVESPDMKNVYDGLVVLDKHGEAWITLPNWFQALNSDFRYQLTSIGSPNPNLFVAQEVAANKFKISGGKAGSKVSWQVTGIRQDAYAKTHRIQVETEKPPSERGRNLYPDTFKTQPQETVASASPSETTGEADRMSEGQQSGHK